MLSSKSIATDSEDYSAFVAIFASKETSYNSPPNQ
jgi:hypothetical protein